MTSWVNGALFAYMLLGLNLLAAIGYTAEQNWPKALYFTGATILTIGVILME